MSVRRGPSSLSSNCSNSSNSSNPRKYSLRHLVESPLPSPGLPSIIPRHGKKTPSHGSRRFWRLLFCAGLACVILWLLISPSTLETAPSAIRYLSNWGDAYEVIGEDAQTHQPSIVMAKDARGKVKWTIAIPPGHDFPLLPEQYSDICSQSTDVARHVLELNHRDGGHNHHGQFNYYHVDPNFMDVAEAEDHGILHRPKSEQSLLAGNAAAGKEEKDLMSEDLETMQGRRRGRVCDRSLTYVLETNDAGFGKTLMGLWMSYGLAKKEGRAFFIDDSNW